MRIRPRQGEYLHQAWGEQASVGVLNIVAPAGSTIDIDITHWLEQTGTTSVFYTVGAGTLGILYYPPLDGDSDLFLPVGLPTTT